MASSTRSPTIASNDAQYGTNAWQLVSNALTSNDQRTYCVTAGNTNYLSTDTYGFSIPTDSSIDGIEVSVERSRVAGTIVDASVRLQLDGSGTLSANDKADAVTNWPTTDTVKVYGGPTDTWGSTITPAQVNSVYFGALFSANVPVGGYATVDAVTITVYYTELILFNGDAQGQATATGQLTTSIRLAGNASAVASAPSNLTTSITMAGSAAAVATATGVVISQPIFVDGSAVATATATGALTTSILMAGAASAVATATGTVTIPVTPSSTLARYIYLAEIEAYDPATFTVVTHRFASGQGYDNAGTFYAPRIENPATFRREVGGAVVGGRQQISLGELTLVNTDGALAYLADDFYDGRTLTLKYGDRTDAYAAFTTVLKATIDSVSFERQRVSVRLKDRSNTLDKAFSTAKYAGNNALPLGLEGTPDDVKGQSKPRVFGRVSLMAPTIVNTSHLIYQVSDKAITGAVLNVFDAGAQYFRSTPDYTSSANLQAAGNGPGAGYYKCYSGSEGTFFRLGSSPYGTVSACVAEDWDHTDCSASGIIKRILSEVGFVTNIDWVEADFTALDQKCVASLGVIVNPDETTASIIDRICATVGAYWGFDNLNRFRIARIDEPSGTPVAALDDNRIINIEKKPDAEYPAWQVSMAADVNYAVQDKKTLAGVVTDDKAAWFSEASRAQVAASATIKTSRLLAEDRTYDQSLFASVSQAYAEAQRRLNVFGVRRDIVNVSVGGAIDYAGVVDVGSIVSVTSSRLGYSSKLFVVTGIYTDYQRGIMDLVLFG